MCFTLPQKIIRTQSGKAIAENGETLDCSLVSAKIGDWVLTQNGLIIAKLPSEQAKKIINKFDFTLK